MKHGISRIFAMLIALLQTIVISTPLEAQTYVGWVMVFQNTEGEFVEIPMTEVGSLVAFDDALDFTILSSTGNILAENVLKVSFEQKSSTGIHTIKFKNIISKTVSDKVTLIGVAGKVTIYDATGKRQMQVTATGGETVINIARLPAGVYVAKVGKQTFKLIKK